MALEPGTRLGAYEILTLIGVGGMGEVYRAKDTRLDRIVAVKVLPPSPAEDPQFRERFEREARAIAQLGHPHICTLHDVGQQDQFSFLVLEHLDGEPLDRRLLRGPIPVAEALTIATHIADALTAAHRVGIVHRDLKPANIFLTKAGAKLLDFGLAKTAAPVVTTSSLSMLPTTPPAAITAQGAILGTFQYMAPEQIEGLEADPRTDIFAFGTVLFEMIIGRPPFEGKTRASLLGAILKDAPPRLGALQPAAPAALERVITACLEKDPDDRYQSARDLRRDLTWVAAAGDSDPSTASGPFRPVYRSRGVAMAFGSVLVAALLAATWVAVGHLREATPKSVEFTVDPPENGTFAGVTPEVAISPDGEHVAFVAVRQGERQIWVRSLADPVARALSGSEGASYPFWSPDSKQLGFFAGSKLKKIAFAGGPTTVLADAGAARGASWGARNVIVFVPNVGPLYRVGAAGGLVTPVTSVDAAQTEIDRWPAFLPDGTHFLFTRTLAGSSTGAGTSELRTGSIDSADTQVVVAAESRASYGAGFLLYARDANLVAQPFDATARRTTGEPFVVSNTVAVDSPLRYVACSVSSTGTLVYSKAGGRGGSSLEWVDRTGKAVSHVPVSGTYNNVALSPDEKTLALSGRFGSTPSRDLWLVDLVRSIPSRFTFDPNVEANPTWSPDGRRIAYAASGATAGLHVKAVLGGADEVWWRRDGVGGAMDWSPDGRYVVYWHVAGKTAGDLWLVAAAEGHTVVPLLTTSFNEQDAAFSPDGHWLAYGSDESGRDEVYVQPFPSTGAKFPISSNGGAQPRWRADGKELFFISAGGAMMRATLALGERVDVEDVRPLFPAHIWGVSTHKQYAVSRDGQRFLINTAEQQSATTPLTVVLHWLETVPK